MPMEEAMTSNNFTVDLHGMVELLSNHLYSGPQVFVRELLQNGVDALTARRDVEPSHTGAVTFALGTHDGRPSITVTDEGLGLTAEEAETFMSVIGRSSKRDEIGLARESLIGQFGVGILSCFTVSEAITVTTRSLTPDATPIAWTGRADGTWSVTEADDHPVGASVRLVARHGEERYFDAGFLRRHLAMYGELLEHKVWFREPGQTPVLITRDPAILTSPESSPQEVIDLGADLLGFEALDAFPITSAVGQATGIAFVLPHEPPPNSGRADRVYVKGMLVSEATDRLLPDWAFFVRCVVLADGLKPTASREELHTGEVLSITRDELGASVREHLMNLAAQDQQRLIKLLSVHHQAMKALAIHDPEFLALVVDWLPVESAEGRMSFGEFRTRHPVATYTRTVDEFRQLAPIATAQGIGLLCGGYTHDSELIEAAAAALEDFAADLVQVEDLFGGFGVLADWEEEAVAPLVDAVHERIESFDIELAVRRFEPHETPALLAMDETGFRIRSLQRQREQSGDLFGGIVDAAASGEAESKPVFCLNIANPVVGRLMGMAEDQELVTHAVEVLYLQALLMGHHPLQVGESALLNTSLSAILDRAITPDAEEA
jgi:molecular chaperone HtpG